MAIVGLTGAITVYQDELEAFLDPALHYVEPGPELASFETILDAALAAYPDRWLVSLRPNDGRPRMAYWLILRKDGERDIPVSVNPYTAEVLGARSNWTLPTIIRRLHVTLLMGQTGTYLLGLASIGMMVTLIAGVVLWWPSKATWTRSLTIVGGLGSKRLLRDVHQVTGVCVFVFIFLMTVTGTALVFAGIAKGLVRVFVLSDATRPHAQSEPMPDDRVTFDQAVSAAHRALPDHRMVSILAPQGDTGVYVFYAEPARGAFPVTKQTVTVDQYSAKVLENPRLSRRDVVSQSLERWVDSIHAGRVLGSLSQVVVFLAGLALPLLFGSGTYMWYRNRARR